MKVLFRTIQTESHQLNVLPNEGLADQGEYTIFEQVPVRQNFKMDIVLRQA